MTHSMTDVFNEATPLWPENMDTFGFSAFSALHFFFSFVI